MNATLSGQTWGYQCASNGPETLRCAQIPVTSGAPTYTCRQANSQQAVCTQGTGGSSYGCDIGQIAICSINQPPQLTLIGNWGPDGIILTWVGTGISAGVTFEIFRSDRTRALAKMFSNGGNSYSYTDKTALQSQNYTYRVAATNVIGQTSEQTTTVASPNGGGTGPRPPAPPPAKSDETWWLLGGGGLLLLILFVVLVIFLARRKDEE